MELKDKLILGFAFLCAIIIFVVVIVNRPNSDPNMFTSGSYYTPRTTTRVGLNEGNSWSNFARGNKLECVGLSNTTPEGTAISMNGATKYTIIQFFPLTMEALNLSTNVVTINTAQSVLKLTDVVNARLGDTTELQLVPTMTEDSHSRSNEDKSDDGGRYEILAPFAFTFDCSNVDDDRTTLSIVSTNRQIKIVFENISNWFCAGPINTPTVYMNAGEDVTCNWGDHGDHHATIIGYSKNAEKTGGSAGDLIAYGSNNTKMSLYVVENGQWVKRSWYGILKKQ